MAIILTSDVFTPRQIPVVTDVDRTLLSTALSDMVDEGGIVSLLGTTKLGKTTLVKNFQKSMPAGSWSVYLSGQSLGKGEQDLWVKLAHALEIPTSRETGLSNSNKTTWGGSGTTLGVVDTCGRQSSH